MKRNIFNLFKRFANYLIYLGKGYLRIKKYNKLTKAGLNPFLHITKAGKQLTISQARELLYSNHMLVPNVSGFYHNILKMFWDRYGLGSHCLLISETNSVGKTFTSQYPNTSFTTTDYYIDLQPHPQCDIIWDLCSKITPRGFCKYSSIINQATLEHIIDPMQVLRNLIEILDTNGYIYIQTHSPSFHYHGYPRDYLRYFPDWFIDLPSSLGTIDLIEMICIDGHVFVVYEKK